MNQYMNEPQTSDEAYTVVYREQFWICCPRCGKRQFVVTDKTEISDLQYTCKNSNCKFKMTINL